MAEIVRPPPSDTRPLLLGMGWFPDQPGGLNRHFRELVEALAAAGSSPRALVVGPATDPPPSVAIAAASTDSLGRRIRLYRQVTRSLAREAHVVDAHFALYAIAPLLSGGLAKRPLVVHFQGPWADEGAEAGHSYLRVWLKRLVERTVYRRADVFVVLSQAFKRTLVERYGIDPWRVQVVPPGVNLDRFRPGDRKAARERLGLPADTPVVLTVRRLVPRMGLDVLLQAWSRVLQDMNRPAILLIAGDGASRPALEAQGSQAGVSKRVRFLGRVSDPQLVALYQAADLVVVPSTALEGFGLVVLESLAAGTPVLGTRVGGLPEILQPLDGGLLVPPGDPVALAARLTEVIEQPGTLPDAARCRRYAEAFSWTTVAERTIQIYRRAVQPPRLRKPRVVYLDHCARLSGGELALLRLLPALSRVDAHVILAEDGPLVARLAEAGVSVEVLPMTTQLRNMRRHRVMATRAPMAAIGTVLYSIRLAHRLRLLRPELVHTNSLKAAIYGGLAARLAGIPVVWHLRDRVAEDYLPSFAIGMVRFFRRHVSDALIVNSQATLDAIGIERATIVPSPVEINLPELPRNRQAEHSTFTVGMIGRLAPWKGQRVFLEAFALAFPSGAERALIVGSALFGEEQYERDLKAQVSRLGLRDRIEFTGFVDDVAGQLHRLDALVHASLIPEPFGQSVVEGMAAGLPVVATAAGGPAEVIDDGVNGLLYPGGDIAALASVLRRLADDSSLRASLGQAATRRAQDFRPEVVAQQILTIYQSVLANRPFADRLVSLRDGTSSAEVAMS